MTAQVAVLNRVAAVLATDSAATLTRGRSTKIYQNQTKLYELALDFGGRKCPPVGLMVYNDLEWLGLPWEVVVDGFLHRKHGEVRDRETITIDVIADAFIAHLGTQQNGERRDETEFLYRVEIVLRRLTQNMRDARRSWLAAMEERFVGENGDVEAKALSKADERNIIQKTQELMIALVSDMIVEFSSKDRKCSISESDARTYIEDAKRWTSDGSNTIRKIQWEALDVFALRSLRALQPHLDELYVNVLTTSVPSDLHTGLVFVGFSEEADSPFPSLRHLVVDGRFGGRVKRIDIESYDVDGEGRPCTVKAFAQTDVAERLLFGSDDIVDVAFADYLSTLCLQLPKWLSSRGFVSGGRQVKELTDAFKSLAESARRDFLETQRFKIRESQFADIKDVLQFMPKKDMADLAASLVETTAMSRRMSFTEESVGGTVEVAILSRQDGFKWYKRRALYPDAVNGTTSRNGVRGA